MGDDSEWQKLPAEDKCQHKVWKARLAGYEEVTKLFNSFDEKSQEFSKYGGLMKKLVTDSNAVAQEKGLDAVLAFVQNAPTNVCGRNCNDVVNGVVTKCLNASKQKTKEKGIEIVMLYIEAEKPDIVQECLMTGLENKQPKVVIGCIQTITLALRDFGTKVIQVKPLLKHLARLLDDRDKNVREETKQLVIELYRWIGAALKPQMTNFKPIQVQELEAEFENLPSVKAQQCRFMRSQQQLKAKMEEQQASAGPSGDGDGGNGEEPEEEAIDPYDLMTPVDILAQLPKNFYEQIEAKKWQERKEMLEAVQNLLVNPRLENGDYASLMRALLKVVAKDTNVMLVVLAAKIIAGIATGLRKKFHPYGSQCVSIILEKFKEKKVTVVQALREAIDASFQSISLENVMEDALAALENKNPSIKTETALFLARCFAKCTQSSLPKKMLKAYIAPLLKTANEAFPELREASFEALGTAMKVVSEKNMAPFLVDVDALKMQKIQEWYGKCVLLNAKGEPRSGGAGAAPAAAKPAPSMAPAKSTSSTAPKSGSEAPKAVKRPGKIADGKAKAGGPSKKIGKAKKAVVEEKLEPLLSDEAVEEKAQSFFPGDTLTTLASSNWKERLAAMENILKVVSSTSRDDIPCQVCVRTLMKKPGLKDTNFQVLKLKLDVIAHLARNSKFSRRSAELSIPDIVEKVGDVKNSGASKESFTAMSEAVGLEFVSIEVISRAFEQKSPKNQQESLVWMSSAITEFGLKIKLKETIPVINKALAASNPAVRGAAITLLGVIYMYMGDTLRVFFENEKPTLLQQIDAEFTKMKDTKPPAPCRKLLSAAGGGGDGGEDDDDDDGDEKDGDGTGGGGDVAVEDLVPRNDISEKITEALITELADKNWKVRAEALQKVTSILSEAKFVTANLGSLPEALKARLGESNKNLQMTTIAICQTLATALGPHTKSHFKVLGPGLILCLGDSKAVLREKVVTCMNTWAETATLLPLVECEAIYDGLKMENPTLRAELLGWLSERLPNHKQLPVEIRGCIPFVLNCLEDRNLEVRKKAGDALVPFMIHTGYDAFLKALGKCKPSSKDQIQPLLEKARGNLPAKPTKVKKAPPPAESDPVPVKPKAAAKQAAPPVIDDEEEMEKPVPKAEPKKVVKGRGKAPAPSSKKKEEEDFGPVLSVNVTKEQRLKEEKAMKVLKWNFIEVRAEYVEQLRTQMEKNFNKAIMGDLFQTDFKSHIKAIEQLIKCLETQEKETVSNVDLILKWYTVRFYDTNPSMLNKALDYLQRLVNLLSSIDYHLNDIEATSFVPYLILKSGDPKDNVRRDVRNILKLLCKVYPASKMFSFVIEGLKSKVSKQRTELLDELGRLIEVFGLNVCQPSPAHALKTIAGFIGERDNGVRNAALNTIVVAYDILGESVYKFIGNLKEKEQSYLDERIKRSAKEKEKKPTKEPLQTQPQPQQIQRPKTAPAKQQQSQQHHQQAVKKTYQLDIEPEENWEPVCPNLIQLDLDGLMAPVVKPTRVVRPTYDPASSLSGTSDVSTGIDKVVTVIGSGNIDVCIKGLIQIDEVMQGGKVEVLSGHVDHIIVATTKQFKMGVSEYLLDSSIPNQEVVQLFRCLLSTILSIFDKCGLGHKGSTLMLKDLIQALLTIILDQQVERLEGGPQIIRFVNISVVKIINKSDPTNITCAIISLIKECLQSETCSSSFLELVTKCLWKVLNLVPETVNDLNLDRVLYECHRFFQTFPPSSWKSRANLDMPIRTIKTLLHNLTKLKGQKILKHTKLIETSESSRSEVKVYLQSVLAKTNFRQDDGGNEKSKSSNRKMSKTHEVLSEIFTKIGTKENTREGLNDLFDFKKKYPEADVEPFLKKTSPHFQKYINNMLAEIDEERRKCKNTEFQSSKSSKTESSKSSDEEEMPDADYYREKLKELRARCGLDTNNADSDRSSGSKSSAISTDDTESSDMLSDHRIQTEEEEAPPPEPVRQSVDVTSLKARLERIKKMANS